MAYAADLLFVRASNNCTVIELPQPHVKSPQQTSTDKLFVLSVVAHTVILKEKVDRCRKPQHPGLIPGGAIQL